MTYKEKIIKALEESLMDKKNQEDYSVRISFEVVRIIITQLKEQKSETGCWVNGHCSCCGEDIGSKLDTWTNIQQFLFCPKCGANMLED